MSSSSKRDAPAHAPGPGTTAGGSGERGGAYARVKPGAMHVRRARVARHWDEM